MITLLRMDDDTSRPLAFYLAAEEWAAADMLTDDDYFMTWRVNPTVIIGRHQSLEDEVDTAYCRSHGIDIVRRKSGGGAVYADADNVMFSYVAFTRPGETVSDTFSRFTALTAGLLQSMGVDAAVTGRNDLTVDGGKISGYSYLAGRRRHIIHGTLLYDFNGEVMSRALTPHKAKLASHGVKSVMSRVTSLGRYLDMPVSEFRAHAEERLTDSVRHISPGNEAAIRTIEASYYRPGWLEGGAHAQSCRHHERVADGSLAFSMAVDRSGRIEAVTVTGDVMSPEDFDGSLTRLLHGATASAGEIMRRLTAMPHPVIPCMANESLAAAVISCIP